MKIRKFMGRVTAVALSALMTMSGMAGGAVSDVSHPVFAETTGITYGGKATWNGTTVGRFSINGQPAFCMEHSKKTPSTGVQAERDVYENADVRKLLYYGAYGKDASYWGGNNGSNQAIVVTSLALDTVYGSKKSHKKSDGFLAWARGKADPGRLGLYFENTNVGTHHDADRNMQVSDAVKVAGTGGITGTVTSNNPNVTIHNDARRQAGQSVNVAAGEQIWLSAPKTYSGSLNLSNLDLAKAGKYSTILWRTPATGTQDLGQLRWDPQPAMTTSLNANFIGTASVQISKVDATGSKEIPGAVLQLTDANGKELDKWTSDGSTHVVRNLPSNASYTLTELSAPEGYKIAAPVKFTLTQDMQKVDMKDEREPIEIKTKATDNQSQSHRGTFGEKVTITDTVSYTNLIRGKSYRVTGVLHVKNADGSDAGALKDASGKEITAEKTFTAEVRNGSVDLVYTLDSRLLKGKSTVVFEDMYEEGIHVASHADISDEEQEVFYPELNTTATSQGTDSLEYQEGEKKDSDDEDKMIEIRDAVAYRNLVAGKEYTVKGTLMDKATNAAMTDKEGNAIKSEKTFTAAGRNGTVDVIFSVPASILKGKTTVVFEEVYEGNALVASHADINDKGQTLEFPGAQTEASHDDSIDYDEEGTTEITDTVSYSNLKTGKAYKAKGTLMDKETGKEFLDEDGNPVTAETEFVPDEKDGAVNVVFTVASKLLKGKTTVVFENVYKDDVLVVSHADIEDEGQTIEWPGIGTEATSDGKKEADLSHSTVLTDKVEYKNLITGKEYTLKGTLMDKATGKELADKDGSPITAETVFTPDESSGTVEVKFTFDGIHLGEGVDTVVFESLYSDGVLVVTHADINDEGQTVKFRPLLTDIKVNKVDAITKKAIVSKQFEFTLYADEACTQAIKTADADILAGAAVFKGLKFGTYYIKETKAPTGYSLSKEVVKVVVDEKLKNVGETYEITYADTPLPAAGAIIPAAAAVVTDDDTQIMAYVLMAGIAALALVIYGISRKKKEN